MDGEDFERAADLIEMAARPAFRARQEATFRRWLEALPDELFRVRPVLAIGVVGVLMVSGDVEGVEARLRDIERCVETAAGVPDPDVPAAAMVVIDHELFRRLPNQIAVYRAGQALILGDPAGTVTHARRALELAARTTTSATARRPLCWRWRHWNQGDLEAAHRRYTEALVSLREGGALL